MSERIYLSTTYAERNHVKALGAQWDGSAKQWFILPGTELLPFQKWLPEGQTALATTTTGTALAVEDDKGVSLSSLFVRVRTAMLEVFPQAMWVRAEISELKRYGSGHIFLTLVEHDASGKEVAKVAATLWEGRARKIVETFCKATGADFAAGIKVLIKGRVSVNQRGAFTLDIEDIDPAFTLGELEAKLRRIRLQLQTEGVIEKNLQQSLPYDVFKVAVVSPDGAAGLGDFSSEADRLERAGVCVFSYFPAVFQGEKASSSVTTRIQAAAAGCPDLVVVIRGGGAVADLHWLSDLEIARSVCVCPVPVFVGIGHEKDRTLLDELACRSFGTPSKVIQFIESIIRNAAGRAENDFDSITLGVMRMIDAAETESVLFRTAVQGAAQQAVARCESGMDAMYETIQIESLRSLPRAEQLVDQSMNTLRNGTDHLLHQAEAQTEAHQMLISTQAGQLVSGQVQFLEEMRDVVLLTADRLLSGAAIEIEAQVKAITNEAERTVNQAETTVGALISSVLGMGPEQTLKRGFALAWAGDRPVCTAKDAANHETLRLQFHDGYVNLSQERK